MTLIERTIAEERSERAKQRGNLREMLIDFYEGNQHAHNRYLRQWGFEEKHHLPYPSTRLVTRVIDTLSMVYKRPPQRKLVSEDNTEIENDGYQEFIRDNPLYDLQLKKVERYYNLLKNVLYRVSYDAETERFYFYIETDYIPEYGRANKLYPTGYHIPMAMDTDGKEVEEPTFLFISDEEYFFHDEHGKSWPDPNFPDMRNPYGIMPLVDFSEPTTDLYWNVGAKPLVDVARLYNILILNTCYAQHFQAFDQPWARDVPDHMMEKDINGDPIVKVGSDQFLNLGPDGDAGLLGFSPKLVESLEFIRGWLNMELSNYGLKAVFRESGDPMSGFAIVVSNIELLEKRESDIDVFKVYEQQLFDVVRAVTDYHALGYNMPEDAMLQTDFVEPDFPTEPAEERAQAEWEWRNNISSREDYLRRRNPDLSQEEAEQIIEENAVKNRQTRGLFSQDNNNGNLNA